MGRISAGPMQVHQRGISTLNGMLFRADVTYGFAMFLCWGAQRFNMIQLLAIKLMVWWYSGGVPA